jgi:hypothetical protein
MPKRIVFFLVCFCAFSALVLAADLTGKWVAQVPGRDGETRETVFTFKAEGGALSGTMTGRQGQETPIADGKISGDAISFTVTMERGGNTIKWNYSGKVSGDEIQMRREGGRGEPREFVAKRAR